MHKMTEAEAFRVYQAIVTELHGSKAVSSKESARLNEAAMAVIRELEAMGIASYPNARHEG